MQTRNAAWQLLIDNKICKLPVNVIEICNRSDISIIKNSSVHELRIGEVAVSVLDHDKWYVIYDDTISKQRARYTIAHELGHIFLGHPLKAGYHARTIDIDKPETEWQADRFAAGFLAPACVLWGLGLHTVDEIRSVCNISYAAAEIRAARMEVLYKRNKFLLNPLERQVYEKFKGFIEQNKK